MPQPTLHQKYMEPSSEARLSTLEANVDQISKNMVAMSDMMRRDSAENHRQFENLSDKFSSGSKPNWQTWIAAGTLLMVVVSLLGGVALAPLYGAANYTERQLIEVKAEQDRTATRLAKELTEKLAEAIRFQAEVTKRTDQRIDYEREISELKTKIESQKEAQPPR